MSGRLQLCRFLAACNAESIDPYACLRQKSLAMHFNNSSAQLFGGYAAVPCSAIRVASNTFKMFQCLLAARDHSMQISLW